MCVMPPSLPKIIVWFKFGLWFLTLLESLFLELLNRLISDFLADMPLTLSLMVLNTMPFFICSIVGFDLAFVLFVFDGCLELNSSL